MKYYRSRKLWWKDDGVSLKPAYFRNPTLKVLGIVLLVVFVFGLVIHDALLWSDGKPVPWKGQVLLIGIYVWYISRFGNRDLSWWVSNRRMQKKPPGSKAGDFTDQ